MGQYGIPDLIQSENSQLCIGLDLLGTIDEKLKQAEEIIDATAEFAIAYKPNRQYWLDASFNEIRQLTELIHASNSAAIIDHKLSDIGSSNERALITLSQENFDYYTFSPFAGNLLETINIAKSLELGTITLVAMSNPDAEWMITSNMYKIWSKMTNNLSEGIVVGSTNHIGNDVLHEIKSNNTSSFVLAPGLGHQGGSLDLLSKIFGDRVLYTVSRGISSQNDYSKAAKHYHSLIMKFNPS
jgi:orotidine-5'-phosphate decarboxylase